MTLQAKVALNLTTYSLFTFTSSNGLRFHRANLHCFICYKTLFCNNLIKYNYNNSLCLILLICMRYLKTHFFPMHTYLDKTL